MVTFVTLTVLGNKPNGFKLIEMYFSVLNITKLGILDEELFVSTRSEYNFEITI